MSWTVMIGKRVAKKIAKLPEKAQFALRLLAEDIKDNGPVRPEWPNYGKLGGRLHHCHIRKGRPTYVAVWKEAPQGVKLVEVTYVGTHEKAPY